jgi:hypothetical protein
VRQGEVWTLASGLRVLIVSNDHFNDLSFDPVCVPIVRERAADNDLIVMTNDADGVTGTFLLPEVGARDLTGGKRELLISGPTMASVSARLALLFAH